MDIATALRQENLKQESTHSWPLSNRRKPILYKMVDIIGLISKLKINANCHMIRKKWQFLIKCNKKFYIYINPEKSMQTYHMIRKKWQFLIKCSKKFYIYKP